MPLKKKEVQYLEKFEHNWREPRDCNDHRFAGNVKVEDTKAFSAKTPG